MMFTQSEPHCSIYSANSITYSRNWFNIESTQSFSFLYGTRTGAD